MINILHISDIHYGWKKPEEDGIVYDAFFKDLLETISTNSNDQNYCIISGDLVYKGSNDHQYQLFFNDFITRLTKIISRNNILIVAGNHDLNRNWVETNLAKHKDDIYRERTEVEFNDYLTNQEECQLLAKFAPFENFCKEVMHIQGFNAIGYYQNLTPELSIFMLNSALCSSGGADGIIDEGHLLVDTRKLNQWICDNRGRTKVLVMHHPIEHIKDSYREEIIDMCRNGIDFVFAGHLHSQNEYQIAKAKAFISPQLYSSKVDVNGYSIIRFEGGALIDIKYKEWNKRHRKFMDGQSFTGTNGGIWINNTLPVSNTKDIIELNLQEDLDRAMTVYGIRPQWVERLLSTRNLHQRYENRIKDLDYLDIINSGDSYQIIAPAQFGLTCYARYLALKAWQLFQQKWLYVDAKTWTLSKIESDIENAHYHLHIHKEESDCIIIDNWTNNYRELDKIIQKLKNILNNKRVIFLTHGIDNVSIDLNVDTENSIKCIYLKEISRINLHSLVNSIDINHEIAPEDIVVERLNQDIIALNMHRIPYNSVQFIKSYKTNFEKRAINRTKVVEGVLHSIFDNPGTLVYGEEIDDRNCKFIMGYFCQKLIESGNLTFTEEDYLKTCQPFAKTQYNSTNLSDLLRILINNQVIEVIGTRLQFRQIYWVSYFAAIRMKDDAEFAKFMLEDNDGIYNSDLIDFYTGIDGRNSDAITYLKQRIKDLSASVSHHVGIDGNFNPYTNIKWRLSETQQGITQEKLEESIRNSRMPDAIKEAVADNNFDSVKPYTQQIYTFLEEYDVRNLMQILSSASRALRNSEFVSPKDKEELSVSIFKGWEVLMRVLFYLAPLMAKNGYGGLGGANFKLSGFFAKEYAKCLLQIIVAMPYNIVQWYKNEIFSDNLSKLFEQYLLKNDNEIIRHIAALIICNCRPKNFQQILSSYIGSVGKNTFYLGDLYSSLRNNYSFDYMSQQELHQTATLIKSCYIKHVKGVLEPGRDSIAKFAQYQGQLPERLIEKEPRNDLRTPNL